MNTGCEICSQSFKRSLIFYNNSSVLLCLIDHYYFDGLKMGASESKDNEAQILQVFTEEEKRNVHKLYSHIVGNQKSLTDPFLKVK